MPNLVGTGLGQVPTNSMLGGMAYQSPDHASIKDLDLKNLSQINSEIADTAVDVFVYDTRKDSDGGAWRKRTQNTSWYTETLGTSTRGNRKEFPTVAVIVAELGKVTIYDGDDPDLPMWMVFKRSSGAASTMLGYSGTWTTSCYMLNGILCVGHWNGGWGVSVIRFLSDSQSWLWSGSAYSYPETGQRAQAIIQRNDELHWTAVTGANSGIINGFIYDVAMTVLPNAPIDPSTGLPIPTVAVATNGGVSVIKDDGSIVNITSTLGGNYNQSKAITITEENYLWWLGDYYGGSTSLRDSYAVSLDNFPTSDFTWANTNDNLSAGTYYALTTGNEAGEIKIGPVNTWAWNKQERNALGGPAGLAIHKPNIGSESNSLIAAITSNYNTGWMHGDCKGAFLSDTDTASNPELVTNGTFNANVDDWNTTSVTIVRDTTIFSGGGIKVTTPGGASFAYQQVTGLVSGKQYIFTARAYNPSGNSGTDVATISIVSAGYTASTASSTTVDNTIQDLSVIFTASGTTETIYLSVVAAAYNVYGQNGSIGYFDNVSVRLAEEDRSVNNKGLAVYGTVTKSPVATGADLVAYGGPFWTSNYLQQPTNSDLNYGTGNYYFVYWLNSPSLGSDQSVFCQGDYATGKGMFTLAHNSSGTGNQLLVGDGGGSVTIQSHENAGWVQICLVRSSGQLFGYRNGILQGNTTSTQNITSVNNSVVFGAMISNGSIGFAYSGKLALFRTGASAPTAEQVKKIYDDEKRLFQENAKCTLYGSSDAVTALAYDSTTSLLHVGTSGGRSTFSGLKRVENTTTAVATAISASNGLVAEQ